MWLQAYTLLGEEAMVKGVRHRYLAVKIESEKSFPKNIFMKAVLNSICRLYGIYGLSRTPISLIEYKTDEKSAILRCSHDSTDQLRSAISSITEIEGTPVYLRVIMISGTIKALKRKISKNFP